MSWYSIQRTSLKIHGPEPEAGQQQVSGQQTPARKSALSRSFVARKGDSWNLLKNIPGHWLKKDRKGSAMVVCLLLLGIFLTLGVGLMLNSQIFLKVQGFRKLNRLSSYAAENGIKEALEKTQTRAEELYSGVEIDEGLFFELKKQLESGRVAIIEPLLVEAVIRQREEFSGMSWETGATGQISEINYYDGYLKASFELNIKSTGQVQGFSGKRSVELLLGLTFFSGHLPLNQLALAVEKEGFKESDQSKVKIIPADRKNIISNRPLAISGPFIPENALPLISRGLKIFRPDRLPNWLLRQALGLEPNSEPIPDGVYLVKDDLGLGGVYVQGDLTELLMGIENGFQLVQFRQEPRCWLLKFDPVQGKTFFITPEGNEYFELLPVPIIMVNGKIESLAAGKANQEGYLIPYEDEPTPAFLSGVRLTIVCSGKIDLTSNLIPEGLEWKEGLPYLKSKQSQLIIWSTGKDFQSEELVDGGINLVSDSDRIRIIAANLIAGGQGAKATPTSAEVKLIGSLAATTINLGQNQLTIFPQTESTVNETEEPDLQVYSEKALLHLSEFRILEWRSVR
ncbi:MAG: hypothetical protein H5U06_05760 [Candidatus Aminicenantes bacterium]|nr:hypothetical protein [Candidatus Aminicenantes bacterium]